MTELAKNLTLKALNIDIWDSKIIDKNDANDNFLFNKQDIGKNVLASYRRVSNILDQEIKKNKLTIKGMPDSILFKKDEEKILFEEINGIRKYLSSNFKSENYEKTLEMFANSKKNTDNFFDNVIVNDKNESIKTNRLELLKMFCMTLDNFIDFSKVEGS